MGMVKEHLLKMRELLADSNCWTQGDYARDDSGKSCGIMSPAAKKWCLRGASWRVGGIIFGDILCTARTLGFHTDRAIVVWNDAPGRTHAEVLARIDAALEHEMKS